MIKETLLERIRKHHLFDGLPDGDLDSLLTNSDWINLRGGQKLFEAGGPVHHVFIVCYGAVKLIQTLSTGEEVILHFVPAGGLVAGVVAMQEKGKYPLTAVSLEDSGFIRVKSECFRKIVSDKGKLATLLLQMVSQRIAELHGEKMLKKGSVSKQIADFLLRQLGKQPVGSGSRITMRLTRQDIANSVGTTVETVIRILSQWTKLGIVSTEDHHIEIIDKPALLEIIERD